MNNIKIHKVKVVSIVLLFFCLLACFMCSPILNQSFVIPIVGALLFGLLLILIQFLNNHYHDFSIFQGTCDL